VVREKYRIRIIHELKEATQYVASICLKYPKGAENIVNHQQHDNSDTSMPEETHYKVEDTYNNMEEKSENDKQDYQTDDHPYLRTDLREIDHFLSKIMDGRDNTALTSYAVL